jgi:putative transposase
MGTFTDNSNYDVDFGPPRNPLKRLYGHGDLHFITFSCYRRRAFLGTPQSRDCFVSVLDVVRGRHQFHLFGYVVMPEHVHLLISEPPTVTPSSVLQVLKQKVSRELGSTRPAMTIPQRVGRPDPPKTTEASFWQRRFYDFNVWNPLRIREKLCYIHANPVRRNLVADPGDWPWSSWSYYASGKPGLLRIDSLGNGPPPIRSQAAQSQNPHP